MIITYDSFCYFEFQKEVSLASSSVEKQLDAKHDKISIIELL